MIISSCRAMSTSEEFGLYPHIPVNFVDTINARNIATVYYKALHHILDFSSLNQVLSFPPINSTLK